MRRLDPIVQWLRQAPACLAEVDWPEFLKPKSRRWWRIP